MRIEWDEGGLMENGGRNTQELELQDNCGKNKWLYFWKPAIWSTTLYISEV